MSETEGDYEDIGHRLATEIYMRLPVARSNADLMAMDANGLPAFRPALPGDERANTEDK